MRLSLVEPCPDSMWPERHCVLLAPLFAVFLAGLLCCTHTGDAVDTMICAMLPPRVGQHKALLPFPLKRNFIQAGAVAWVCPSHRGPYRLIHSRHLMNIC